MEMEGWSTNVAYRSQTMAAGGDVVYRESEEEGEGDGTEDEEDDDESTLGSASIGYYLVGVVDKVERTSPSTSQHRRLDMGRVADTRTPVYSRNWSQASSWPRF